MLFCLKRLTALSFLFCAICSLYAQEAVSTLYAERTPIQIFPTSNPPYRYPLNDHLQGIITTEEVKKLFKTSYLIYPEEVYYGDVVYIVILYHNLSDTYTFVDSFPGYDEWNGMFQNMSITLSHHSESIQYFFDTSILDPAAELCLGSSYRSYYEPGVTKIGKVIRITTPPLLEWRSAFWQKLKESVEEEGASSLDISVKMQKEASLNEIDYSLSHTIHVRKRDAKEMAIFNAWYTKSKPKYVRDEQVAFNNGQSLLIPYGEQYDVCVSARGKFSPKLTFGCNNSRKYDNLIRFRNLFAYVSKKPSNLKGWQELESKFSSGTTMDELHLTSLLIDFKESQLYNPSETRFKRDAIFKWLSERPLAQRLALSYWVGVNFRDLIPSLRIIDTEE